MGQPFRGTLICLVNPASFLNFNPPKVDSLMLYVNCLYSVTFAVFHIG